MWELNSVSSWAVLALLNLPSKAASHETGKYLNTLAQSAEQVDRGSLLELTFKANFTADAAFNPDQIAVDARFVSPSGKTVAVPGFYYQDYTREVNGLSDKFTATGDPVWKVRFAPVEEGRYIYQVTVKDNSGAKTSPNGTFLCVPSGNHGYLRVSKSDPHYFESRRRRAAGS